MRLDAKMKAALVLGLLLSWPVLRALGDGAIDVGAAAIRMAMALVLAYAGVLLVVRVVTGYLPEPEPPADPAADGVEDAVIVEDGGLPAASEGA